MPNTIDLYSPRTMGRVIRRTPAIGRFLIDTLFSTVQHYDTERVDFDMVKGGRPLAPVVAPYGGAKAMKRTGYETKTITLPLIAPSFVTTAADLLARIPGEPLYGGMTPDERAVRRLAEELQQLSDMISRREEWMASKVLFDGVIPLIGDGIKEQVDFKFENHEELEEAKCWDAEGSDPEADFARWQKKVWENGFINCDMAILGSDAADAFIRNASVQKLMDIKDYFLGEISPRELPRNVKYIGYLKKENINLYTYNEVFEDTWSEQGKTTLVPVIPKNKVLLCNPEMISELAYGSYTLVDQKTGAWHTENAARIPDHWIEKNPDRKMLAVYSRPLPVPHEVNAWFVGKVLAD